MKKIPTIFKRDGKYVTAEVNTKAAIVFKESTIAMRKYNGVACMFDGKWYCRKSWQGHLKFKFEANAIFVDYDPETDKTFGWEQHGPFDKYLKMALERGPLHSDYYGSKGYTKGTYELIGPKINGNPEDSSNYRLVKHVQADQLSDINRLNIHQLSVEAAYDALRDTLSYQLVEGVVFYHLGKPVGKLKQRDFNYES